MDDQLKCLFEYTKFHIGIYLTFLTALIGLITLEETTISLPFPDWYLVAMLVPTSLAGVCGGLIASAVPYFEKFDTFMDSKVGPWRWKMLKAKTCTHLEHTFFWVALAMALAGTVFFSGQR